MKGYFSVSFQPQVLSLVMHLPYMVHEQCMCHTLGLATPEAAHCRPCSRTPLPGRGAVARRAGRRCRGRSCDLGHGLRNLEGRIHARGDARALPELDSRHLCRYWLCWRLCWRLCRCWWRWRRCRRCSAGGSLLDVVLVGLLESHSWSNPRRVSISTV